jgi:hypothetical protein
MHTSPGRPSSFHARALALWAASLLAPACGDDPPAGEPTADLTRDAVSGADDAAPDAVAPDAVAPDAVVPDAVVPDAAVPMVCDDPALVALRGECPAAERWGGFLVEVQADYSIVDGKVADGVVPASIPEDAGRIGPCALLRRRSLFCDPPCVFGDTCGEGGACIPFPLQQDLGTVTITGLEKAISLTAIQPGNAYFDTDLPHPISRAGCAVALTSTASPIGPLALSGATSPILAPVDAQWTFARDSALAVLWDSPPAPTRGEILLTVTVDQHGSSPLSLRCLFPDTGQGEVPREAVNALIDAGVSGYPNGRLVRRTVDRQQSEAGCVDLTVSSAREVTVRVAGSIPCRQDADCPEGQSCDRARELCR